MSRQQNTFKTHYWPLLHTLYIRDGHRGMVRCTPIVNVVRTPQRLWFTVGEPHKNMKIREIISNFQKIRIKIVQERKKIK